MATIGGKAIIIEKISVGSDVDISLSNIMGSNENQLVDAGMSGLRVSITARVSSASAYDTLIAAIMTPGQKELVIDSGWAHLVYTDKKSLNRSGKSPILYKFSVDFLTADPYVYTTASAMRSKSITSNNQQWSADDSSNDIDTSGNVNAKPDIQIIGGPIGANYTRLVKSYDVTDATVHSTTSTSYVLKKTVTLPASVGMVYNLTYVSCLSKGDTQNVYIKCTYQAASLNGGAETTLYDTYQNNPTVYILKSASVDITTAENEDLVIRYYLRSDNPLTALMKDCRYVAGGLKRPTLLDISVHNVDEDSTLCDVANTLHPDEVVRINADGTGHIDYDDEFTDEKYIDSLHDSDGLTYDGVNDELDIADDGYIIFDIDTKYPVTGIPTLTAQIDITAGVPTIQVALDDNGIPGTWHDIDTAIVDDIETEYKLDSGSDVKFANQTKIWFRIDCGSTGTVTCTVKSFELDIDIITIDAQMPVINTGGPNTFQCDQSSDSSLSCTVDLIYPDRKWA